MSISTTAFAAGVTAWAAERIVWLSRPQPHDVRALRRAQDLQTVLCRHIAAFKALGGCKTDSPLRSASKPSSLGEASTSAPWPS